jgi:hypothetical protein
MVTALLRVPRCTRAPSGHLAGASHPRATLTDAQVREIRALYLPHVRGYLTLARQFGVGASTVRDIVTYRTRVNA